MDVGDVVRLASGSFLMTVDKIWKSLGECRCSWYDPINGFGTSIFQIDALVPTTIADPHKEIFFLKEQMGIADQQVESLLSQVDHLEQTIVDQQRQLAICSAELEFVTKEKDAIFKRWLNEE